MGIAPRIIHPPSKNQDGRDPPPGQVYPAWTSSFLAGVSASFSPVSTFSRSIIAPKESYCRPDGDSLQ
jgi:hypothetical protein